MPRKSSGVIAAFAISPLAASAATSLCMFAVGHFVANPNDEYGPGAVAAILFVISLLAGYLAAVVLGVPGYALFRRIGWVHRRHWFLLGTAIGCVSAALLVTAGYRYGHIAESNAVSAVAGMAVLTAPLPLVMGLVFTWQMGRAAPDIDRIAATFD